MIPKIHPQATHPKGFKIMKRFTAAAPRRKESASVIPFHVEVFKARDYKNRKYPYFSLEPLAESQCIIMS